MSAVQEIEDLGAMAFSEILLAASMSKFQSSGEQLGIELKPRELQAFMRGLGLLRKAGRLAKYEAMFPEGD